MNQKERNIITLDIGNAEMKALFGSLNDTTPKAKPFFELHGVTEKTVGLSKRGTIRNKVSFCKSIQKIIDMLVSFSEYTIEEVNVLYTPPSIHFYKKTIGTNSIRNPEGIYITEEWLEEQKEKISERIRGKYHHQKCIYLDITSIIADNEEITHDPYEYTVLKSLYIEYRYALVPMTFVESLEEGIENAIAIRSIRPTAIANGSLLSEEQKERGAIVCDIGSEFTNITVYQHGVLSGVSIMQFGGNTITDEIALLKKISIQDAEKLKCTADSQESDLRKREQEIIRKKIAVQIKKHFLPYIKEIDPQKNFPGGITLIGGGSLFPGIDKVIRRVTDLHTVSLTPTYYIQGAQRQDQQPIWQSAYGLLYDIAINEIREDLFNEESEYSLGQMFMNFLHNISKSLR